ncbi:uncharacterized protein LOC144611541 [Rhinoraja longicauda]
MTQPRCFGAREQRSARLNGGWKSARAASNGRGMSEEETAALPRLFNGSNLTNQLCLVKGLAEVHVVQKKLPEQPYRSRFYRDNAFGRLTGKPVNVILQKNANASTVVNNFLAGLDNINNTEPLLDSTSHFEVQFSEVEDPRNKVPKDLQCKKKESAAGAQLQLLENTQSHKSPQSYPDKKGENNGSCSSKKQTEQWPEPAAIAADKTSGGGGSGGGEGVCIAEAVEDRRDFDEPEGLLLIDVDALVLEADISPGDKFGITYNAEASVVNSTPDPSKPLGRPKSKMRLCFNTSVTPIAVNRPNVRTEQKNIVSRILGNEEPKTTSTCFGKKPTVSGMTRPLQVEPSVFAPKCNESEFELMEEESFCFESWTTIPRKVLTQKPVEQENKSAVDIKNEKKKEKQQRADEKQIAVTDEKEKLLNEQLSCPKQAEDTRSCKQNKQLKPEESGKSSVVCPMKNNVAEELQNEPLSASKQSLTSMQKRKLEYRKPGKSGEKCVKIQGNRGDCKTFQEESPSCILRNRDKINDSEQFVANCKNSAETGSSNNLARAVEGHRKNSICSGIETPNKQSVGKVPISSDQHTKCMDLVTTPLANNDENDILSGLETHQPRASLFSGRTNETIIVNGPLALSEVPQKTKSKSLNTNETAGIFSMSADNQQKEYPYENVVPSISGLEKHQKEASQIPQASFPSFGIKPALSTLPHTKRVIPITSVPNVEPEFELEDEENFCLESWITIPKKAVVQKQVLAEQEKKPDDNTKTMLKKGRTQKTASARKPTIQSKETKEKQQVQHKKNKAKYEKQSRKRSACPLNNDTEKNKEEVHNESSSHSTFCLPPRQKKKSARHREKFIIEYDGNEEQEKLHEQELLPQECNFQVKPYENSPEKAECFDHGVITSKKFLELERMKEQEAIKSNFHDQKNKNRMEEPRRSEHDLIIPKSLPEYGNSINDCNEMEAKLPLVTRSESQNKRAEKQQKQKAKVKKEMSKGKTCPRNRSSSMKSLPPPYEHEENLVRDNTFNARSRSRRDTRPPPKWWIVQQDANFLENELKTNYLPAQKANLQERMKPGKSAKSQIKIKTLFKRASSAQNEQLETEECSSEEHIFEKDIFENVCNPDYPAKSCHIKNVSVKKQSRKKKWTSVSTKPKKRLFSEAEEMAKPSDIHQCKKQKQKVHHISVRGKNEMEQTQDSDQLTSLDHVSSTSTQIVHLTSLSPKKKSQRFLQKSSASFSATYVIESPQRAAHEHPEMTEVSSGTPNRVAMSPRKSITRPADQLCTQTQVPQTTPYHVTLVTRKKQNKTVPSQPCKQTLNKNEESGEPEASTSVKGMKTLKQGHIYRNVPIFNSSGPGPTSDYHELSDAGDDGNLQHEVYNNEKMPSEVGLKSTQVWSEKESSEIFMDCVRTSDMCDFFYPLRTEYNDNRSIAICKSLNCATFACGKLVLGPYKEKGCQMVYKDTMIFHILKGDLGITIYRTTYHLKEGDYFFVPSGNTYNVTNLQDTEAVLLFTQLKGAKME